MTSAPDEASLQAKLDEALRALARPLNQLTATSSTIAMSDSNAGMLNAGSSSSSSGLRAQRKSALHAIQSLLTPLITEATPSTSEAPKPKPKFIFSAKEAAKAASSASTPAPSASTSSSSSASVSLTPAAARAVRTLDLLLSHPSPTGSASVCIDLLHAMQDETESVREQATNIMTESDNNSKKQTMTGFNT